MNQEEISAALNQIRAQIELCADLSDFQRTGALRGVKSALVALNASQETKQAGNKQAPRFPSLEASGGLAFRAPNT